MKDHEVKKLILVEVVFMDVLFDCLVFRLDTFF